MSADDQFELELKKLRIRNFRTFESLEIDLNGRLVFFIGENGAGKTSILEAISIMSSLRSFRRAGDRDMVRWNSPFYFVQLDFENSSGSQALGQGFGREEGGPLRRKLSHNGRRVKTINEFIGRFHTIIFSPNDIRILDTEMSERRKYIDMVLSTLSPRYLSSLQKYRKLLTMRSSLLRKYGASQSEYLDAIDRQTAEAGAYIQKERAAFLQAFQTFFDAALEKISGGAEGWRIEYAVSIEEGHDEASYRGGLLKGRPNDIKMRHTTRGVHRDRIYFRPAIKPGVDMDPPVNVDIQKNSVSSSDVKNMEIKEIASQGQKRSAALALKIAQFEYTGARTHETPVLLIDDVLNELDIGRRKRFLEFLNETGQALVTATDLAGIEDFIAGEKNLSDSLVYQVAKGEGGKSVVKAAQL